MGRIVPDFNEGGATLGLASPVAVVIDMLQRRGDGFVQPPPLPPPPVEGRGSHWPSGGWFNRMAFQRVF